MNSISDEKLDLLLNLQNIQVCNWEKGKEKMFTSLVKRHEEFLLYQ